VTTDLPTPDRPGAVLIDLGGDVWCNRVEYEGEWVGIDYYHRSPSGRWCDGGWILFDHVERLQTGGEAWTLEQAEPITLSPSLLCTMPGCGHHGFIREGRWVGC
jgi:hypothetical protein